jgi:hypothetical protein
MPDCFSRSIFVRLLLQTRGGTFDISDFCFYCDGRDTGRNLVILFNTDETVILKGSADGQPFSASVIAPYSRVELDGSAVYLDGFVAADTFATTGDNAGNLEIRGNIYGSDLYCGPTEAPTWAPTAVHAETLEKICLTSQILLTNDEDAQPLIDGSIAIESSDTSTVTFSITNTWKNRLQWLVPVYDQGGESMVCADQNRLSRPLINTYYSYTAQCTDGKASVHLFVRDWKYRSSTHPNIYNCNSDWWGDDHYMAAYSFELSCDGTEICSDQTTVEASQSNLPDPVTELCKLPAQVRRFAIITKSSAEISMHNIWNAIAIGGLLSNPQKTNVQVASTWTRQSFVERVVDECDIEFMGGRRIGTPLADVIDFSHFEWLARNAYNHTENNRKIIVLVRFPWN